METAGSVDDDDIAAAIDSGIYSIERDRSRIGSGVATDEIGTGTLGPRAQLIDGPGAKGVRGTNEHRHPILFQEVRELPDKGGFAGAIDAYDEDDRWTGSRAQNRGIAVSRAERRLDRLLQSRQKLFLRLDESAARLSLDLPH